ncbi:MAG TPA: ATP-binding protein [Vicinamibacterales bacterium]|nr:ATP-binding protein [Vicinamibacterales bacterium]
MDDNVTATPRRLEWSGSAVDDDARPAGRVAEWPTAARPSLSGPAGPLASMLDASPDGMLLGDDSGAVIAWNSAMLVASAFSPDAMAAASIDTVDACFTAFGADEMPEALSGPATLRNIVSAHDGRLFERTEQKIDLSPAQSGRLVFFRPCDLASEAPDAARRQLRSLSQQRRHALRMEAVGRLSGGIAHDFNNMLTVMIGCAEQLEIEVGRHDALTQVVHAAQRAAELTRQLLAFSRQQVLRPCVIDVASVVEAMGGMVARLIGDDVRLEIDAPAGLSNVVADPSQLEQIVLNLSINARDAMPRGGRLGISVRQTSLAAARPGRAMQPPGDYVQLIVTDTGNGIAPDLLGKVFEPFFTTKGSNGTGLGLSTVYGIVKQSNGFIWVDSEVGCGTTFTIDLPVTAQPKDAAVLAQGVRAELTPGAGERLLIVEDLEPVRLVTQEMLEAEGYQVVAAASPREALAIMERMGDHIDLVLSDVMMPEMTGGELAAALRARRPTLPVLFMSGLPRALDWSEPGSFLAKPFTRAMLLSHVRARLQAAATAA